MSPLERSILETIVYFDLFDYPLTLTELHRYLWQSTASLTEVAEAATRLRQVELRDGIVCLRGRGELAKIRADRYLESERKFLLRRNYLWLLSLLPGVQAIWIVNTMAYHNVRRSSDIDLLIVTAPGKIWSTRFFTTAVAKILGLRPAEHHTQDTLCLSFYLTADELNLQALTANDNERYEAYWLAETMPVYDPANLLKQCFIANPWLEQCLPNAQPMALHNNRMVQQTWFHNMLHFCGRFLLWESLWRWLQIQLLPKKLKALNGPVASAVVVLSPTILKFHTRDPRPELLKRWEEKFKNLSGGL
ncbi:MAG: hypothetical protein ACD_43C00030G0010 [uncultured bacterium]|nr:MAG: hypothetical protein ACD_43C00030G0010 [uncultured bacterium]